MVCMCMYGYEDFEWLVIFGVAGDDGGGWHNSDESIETFKHKNHPSRQHWTSDKTDPS